MGLLLLAVVCLALFHHLTGKTPFGVRKDGPGVDAEVKNMNALQGNEKVLHDDPDHDRTLI